MVWIPLRVLRIFLDLLAQPGDVHIHGTRGRVPSVAPNIAQQFFARKRRARMLDQIAKQLKLLSRKRNRLAVARHFGATHINLHVAKLVARRDCARNLRGAPAKRASIRASNSVIWNGLVR